MDNNRDKINFNNHNLVTLNLKIRYKGNERKRNKKNKLLTLNKKDDKSMNELINILREMKTSHDISIT